MLTAIQRIRCCQIVETDDIIMVAKKGETQSIKDIVSKINKRKEIQEHTIMYKSWGSCKMLTETQECRIERIMINPMNEVEIKIDNNICANIIVIDGNALACINKNKGKNILKNENMYISAGDKCMLINNNSKTLEIIKIENLI